MKSLLLFTLTAFSVFAAEKTKKTADANPPPEPPKCHAALTGLSGLARYTHAALELSSEEKDILVAMNSNALYKRDVMKRSSHLFGLDQAKTQLFLTIRDPESVRRAVQSLNPELREYKTFTAALKKLLGVSLARVETENLYEFYADEIWDLLPARMKAPPKASETVLRFASRTLRDLAAFENFKDGYSVSGEHYARSLRQFDNGAYQILYAERAGQVWVKLGLLPMFINRRPALMIDFVEVDYRGDQNDGPAMTESRIALNDALRFLNERAEAMDRELFAIAESHTSWVTRRLQRGEKYGAPAAYAGQPVNGRYGYLDDRAAEYRVLEPHRGLVFTDEENDPNWQRTITSILAPAIARDPSLGARLRESKDVESKKKRERLLESVAKDLVTHEDLMTEAKVIYSLPDEYPVGWAYFAKKLDQYNPSRHQPPSVYSNNFVINRKVFRLGGKLPRFGQ